MACWKLPFLAMRDAKVGMTEGEILRLGLMAGMRCAAEDAARCGIRDSKV